MTNARGIEKYSLPYAILKKYVDICFTLFYKIRIRGRENVNIKDVLIFAPNHQNALMDALAMLQVFKYQPVFLGRSDLFKSKAVTGILNFLKILPVYRIRDGYGELQKNDATFIKTIDVLENRRSLCIFPEGSHGIKKQLRPLKKGIARIAMQAMESTDSALNIKIVPVGLYYQDHHRRASHLFIQLGEPFEAGPYLQIFKDNPAKAYTMLLDELRQRMKGEMLQIEKDEINDTVEMLIAIYDALGRGQQIDSYAIFAIQKRVIAVAENMYDNDRERYNMLASVSAELADFLRQGRFKAADIALIQQGQTHFATFVKGVLLMIGAPLFLYSYIQNLIPQLIVGRLKKLPKDPQFISSVNFVGGIVLYPLFYIIQAVVITLVTESLQWGLACLAILPLTWFFRNLWIEHFSMLRKVLQLRKHTNIIKILIDKILQLTDIRY